MGEKQDQNLSRAWADDSVLCGYILLKLTPGPSAAMNAIASTIATITHPQLRVIPGICISLLRMRGLPSNVHIYARADFPPKDAAAAESKINKRPTGLNAPAIQESDDCGDHGDSPQ